MPYIKNQARIEMATGRESQTAGELNYAFTLELIKFFCISTKRDLKEALLELVDRYAQSHDSNYATYNEIVGALECAQLEFKRRVEARFKREWVDDAISTLRDVKQEFYDRVVVPYEKEKIKENGDVY